MDEKEQIPEYVKKPQARTPLEILNGAAETNRERTAKYGGQWKLPGEVLALVVPKDFRCRTALDHQLYNLFNLVLNKMCRFAASGFTHQDSAHDSIVYWAMIESLLEEKENE